MNEREQRLQEITEIVQQKETISVEQLQEFLGVSGSTVRSDLRILVNEGKIRREHGRVIRVVDLGLTHTSDLPSFERRLQINRKQKESIARIAESYIEDNDSIILDASSTCYHLAKRLSSSGKILTVVTNSINTAQLLHKCPRMQVILIGGTIGVQNNTEGTIGIDFFNHLNIKKCFVSGYGISLDHGITDFSLLEIQLKRKFLEVSQLTYAPLDSSKFGVISVGTFCSLNTIKTIITDDDVDLELFKKYRERVNIVNPSMYQDHMGQL